MLRIAEWVAGMGKRWACHCQGAQAARNTVRYVALARHLWRGAAGLGSAVGRKASMKALDLLTSPLYELHKLFSNILPVSASPWGRNADVIGGENFAIRAAGKHFEMLAADGMENEGLAPGIEQAT